MNDVLSGRGARFNQHPGNKRFRSMLEEKKDAYVAGTKKQKMEIAKVIVEAVYSKNPPGRFLKKCSETGQWKELSRRDAADKAAQAMAYLIKGESLKVKRRLRRFNLPPPSQPQGEGDDDGDVCGKSHKSADRRRRLQQHPTKDDLKSNHSSSASQHGLTASWGGGAAGTNDDAQPDGSDTLHLPGNSNPQQQVLPQQMQQQNALFSASASLPTTLSISTPRFTWPQSQLSYNDFVQIVQQRSTNPSSNAILSRSMLGDLQRHRNDMGIFSTPYGAQQMNQMQLSMRQQQNNQLLASSLGASSNIQLPFQQQLSFQQQQMQPLDPILQQTLQADLIHRNVQETLPSNEFAAASSTWQDESNDVAQNEPAEDDCVGV